MKMLLVVLHIGFAVSIRVQGQTNPVSTTVETLICIRHGEKPATGLGQLSCQGLNRALAQSVACEIWHTAVCVCVRSQSNDHRVCGVIQLYSSPGDD